MKYQEIKTMFENFKNCYNNLDSDIEMALLQSL